MGDDGSNIFYQIEPIKKIRFKSEEIKIVSELDKKEYCELETPHAGRSIKPRSVRIPVFIDRSKIGNEVLIVLNNNYKSNSNKVDFYKKEYSVSTITCHFNSTKVAKTSTTDLMNKVIFILGKHFEFSQTASTRDEEIAELEGSFENDANSDLGGI